MKKAILVLTLTLLTPGLLAQGSREPAKESTTSPVRVNPLFLDLAQPTPTHLQTSPQRRHPGRLKHNPYDPEWMASHPFAPESTANPHGEYGCRYQWNSTNNPLSPYSSRLNNGFAFNPLPTQPPRVLDWNHRDP